MAKTSPDKPLKQKYGTTEFGRYGLDFGRTGQKGLEENVPRVDRFNDRTIADINARLGAIRNRAEDTFDQSYRDTMAKSLANQYGRYGTTGNTSSLYRNDLINKQAQRELADMAYNDALNYESNVDREMKRRYDTLDMYNKLYGYGDEVGRMDWNTENQNRDIAYQNDVKNWQTQQKQNATLTNLGMDAIGWALAVPTGGTSLMVTSALKPTASSIIAPNAEGGATGMSMDSIGNILGGMNNDVLSSKGKSMQQSNSKQMMEFLRQLFSGSGGGSSSAGMGSEDLGGLMEALGMAGY